jgi:hypothetical protein
VTCVFFLGDGIWTSCWLWHFQCPAFFVVEKTVCCSPNSSTTTALGLLVPSDFLIRCESIQMYDHHLMTYDPLWLKLRRLPHRAGRTIEPQFVAILVARRVSQADVPSFYLVTIQPQKLAAIIVDVMQVFAWLMVDRSLSGGATNSTSQGSRRSLPYTRLAGVMLVVSWLDALYVRKKMSSLASFRCYGTIFVCVLYILM